MGSLIWNQYKKLALDSNCFIYLMEGSPYEASLLELFRCIEQGEVTAISSTLTVTELLTGPYKTQDVRLIEEYRTAILNFPNCHFRSVDCAVADKAAELRGQYALKTPDAIQLATAIIDGAEAFVTNDKDFRSVDFNVIFLS